LPSQTDHASVTGQDRNVATVNTNVDVLCGCS